MKILVLNGPNLNLLGMRETGVYGEQSIEALKDRMRDAFPDHLFTFYQSNLEGALIDRLHEADNESFGGVVFNPGGYTHTSVAIRDAVAAIVTPVVEVHISNTLAREAFRHVSVTGPACAGQITGFGTDSYLLGVEALVLLSARRSGQATG